MKYRPLIFVFLINLCCSALHAQYLDYSASVHAEGLIFTQEESPFWFHSNTRDRIDEKTNYSAWINGRVSYEITPEAHLDFGIGVLYHDGYSNKMQLDESYFSFNNTWLEASIGRKQREELYSGLSASNENILWSLNARPLPGIRLDIVRPIYLWKEGGIAFTASLEEYLTDDDRYVDNLRIHHKNFHLIFDGIRNFQFSVGLQHFVQWAGTSPDYGKLPSSFRDYVNVFTGKEGGDNVQGEEANALGNHLGSYEINIKTKLDNYNVEILYNHLFEDNSGRVLRNTPDGRYGIYIEDNSNKQDQWINAVMYEFYYTKNQSKNTPTTDGIDNYFNNNLYRSGWTYENRILGVPFITLDPERFRINNNQILVHHIGLAGNAFNDIPFKLLTSYRINYGAKGSGAFRKNKVLSTFLKLQILQNQELFDVNLQLATDFSNIAAPNFGAGIEISKKLF